MKFNKDDIYSIAGSVAFHLAIFLILLFTVLRTEIPEEDGGVLVNFGNVNSAAGTFEPKYTGTATGNDHASPSTYSAGRDTEGGSHYAGHRRKCCHG